MPYPISLAESSSQNGSAVQSWQLQEAKNRLSAVVDAAIAGQPQQVTRRGEPVVVVIAAEDYERLLRLEKVSLPAFSKFLLDMPQDDGEFDRLPLPTRRFDP